MLSDISQQPLTTEEIRSVNFCLALLRNILHIPERPSIRLPQKLSSFSSSFIDHTTHNTQQNQIVCNLFAQGLSPLLLKLLDCPQRVTIILLKSHYLFSVILIKVCVELRTNGWGRSHRWSLSFSKVGLPKAYGTDWAPWLRPLNLPRKKTNAASCPKA